MRSSQINHLNINLFLGVSESLANTVALVWFGSMFSVFVQLIPMKSSDSKNGSNTDDTEYVCFIYI